MYLILLVPLPQFCYGHVVTFAIYRPNVFFYNGVRLDRGSLGSFDKCVKQMHSCHNCYHLHNMLCHNGGCEITN